MRGENSTMKPNHTLFDSNTTAIIFGNQVKAVQRMLDFDFLCQRSTPSVAAVVDVTQSVPGSLMAFFGRREVLIPVYPSLEQATRAHSQSDVCINFASFRSAYEVTMEAIALPSIRTVVVIAEGIPERLTRQMNASAKEHGKWIIGPATVGGFAPGSFKIGNAGGAISNLVASGLFQPGSVGFVSKSGGMLNEMANVVFQNSDGLFEGVAIGGDAYPGSSLMDHIVRYEANPEIKMIVLLGEVGGSEEYRVVEALKAKQITKPIVAWVTGTCSKVFPSQVQFGHAGAMARGDAETADAKNRALREAGAHVPRSFDEFGEEIGKVFSDLKRQGKIVERPPVTPPEMPKDYDAKNTRKSTNVVCTISDDSKEELLYAGVPISKVIAEGYSLGDVISLLWFKRRLPAYATEFVEMALKITADHGPCVSGAHNTIITARAGRDLMSSLASGLLTIGPRFGGALTDAAHAFKDAFERGLTPRQFMAEMKTKNTPIPGIGHRVKSLTNPDMRVKLIKDWAAANLPRHDLLDYAMEVEKLTTEKRNNLILNVDGCIGIVFVDLLRSTDLYNSEEINQIIDVDTLNGLFVLGRTIGMIGHYFDQKRLNSKLYRHPWDDVLYMLPSEQ